MKPTERLRCHRPLAAMAGGSPPAETSLAPADFAEELMLQRITTAPGNDRPEVSR